MHDEKETTGDLTASQLPNKPAGYFPTTPEEIAMNRSVNRKIDIFILPLLSLLYLFSGLDRGISSLALFFILSFFLFLFVANIRKCRKCRDRQVYI